MLKGLPPEEQLPAVLRDLADASAQRTSENKPATTTSKHSMTEEACAFKKHARAMLALSPDAISAGAGRNRAAFGLMASQLQELMTSIMEGLTQ